MSEKTLPPTEKRLKKAREDGDVAKSQIFTQLFKLSACFVTFFFLRAQFQEFVIFLHETYASAGDFRTNHMLLSLAEGTVLLLKTIAPVLVVALIFGSGAELFQVGISFSFAALVPRWSRIGFFCGLKRIFLGEGDDKFLPLAPVKEAAKLATYLTLLLVTVGLSLYTVCLPAVLQPKEAVGGVIEAGYVVSIRILPPVLLVGLFLGITDLWVVRRKRLQRLRMDVEEYKRELRESEGDPHQRAARRQFHRELLVQEVLHAVRNSKVLLINR